MIRSLLLLSLVACGGPGLDTADEGLEIGALVPTLHAVGQVVPGPGLPAEVRPQAANNNLDIAWHDGRLFLAFRTAPDHFASADTELYVVSTTDEQTWRYEGHFALGTDVREPQLVSWQGTLHLWFAVLGDNPTAFEPQGSRHTTYSGPGEWAPLEDAFEADLIPWRIKPVDGRLHVVGYTGGGGVYDPDTDEPIRVRWLASDDGLDWTAAIPGQEVVHEGGGSESDFAILDDGTLVAVLRNEAGDQDGFGSKVCLGAPSRQASWDCAPDRRKYDSPLVFEREGRVWLIGRRTLAHDGAYQVADPSLSHQQQYLENQLTYWQSPKRCALWEIDPATRTVHHILDLPSAGDTCFPEAVELEGELLVYNYSSDPDAGEPSWLEGQNGPTNIYRQVLDFTP